MIEELQVQITATRERLAAALEADQRYEAARHRARLKDLIDTAARRGVDSHALGGSDPATQLTAAGGGFARPPRGVSRAWR